MEDTRRTWLVTSTEGIHGLTMTKVTSISMSLHGYALDPSVHVMAVFIFV